MINCGMEVQSTYSVNCWFGSAISSILMLGGSTMVQGTRKSLEFLPAEN